MDKRKSMLIVQHSKILREGEEKLRLTKSIEYGDEFKNYSLTPKIETDLSSEYEYEYEDEDFDTAIYLDTYRDDFKDINFEDIAGGILEFDSVLQVIKVLNMFDLYKVDFYLDILLFLVENYILELREINTIMKNVNSSVLEDISSLIGSRLSDYLFTIKKVNLKPEDVAVSPTIIYEKFQNFEYTKENIRRLYSGIAKSKLGKKIMISTIDYLENYNFEISKNVIVDVAMEYGNLDMLKYLHKKNYGWSKSNCEHAAKSGNLECLKYARIHNCPWDKNTCSKAAEFNRLNCLIYSHKNNCPWDENTCTNASKNGFLSCLDYAHVNGCAWDKNTLKACIENGKIKCLKYMIENGYPISKNSCDLAIKNGHYECLKFSHKSGSIFTNKTAILAASGGHLKCMKYIFRNNCYLDEKTCSNAAKCDRLNILHFAVENDFPWDLNTCANAAASGSLRCLMFSFENGCDWDELTCSNALDNGNMDCLYYARKNSCPWDKRTRLKAKSLNFDDPK